MWPLTLFIPVCNRFTCSFPSHLLSSKCSHVRMLFVVIWILSDQKENAPPVVYSLFCGCHNCISNLVFWELLYNLSYNVTQHIILCKIILFRNLAENGFQVTCSSWFVIRCFKKWEPLFMSKFDFQISLNKFSVVNIYQKTKKVIRYGQYWGKK